MADTEPRIRRSFPTPFCCLSPDVSTGGARCFPEIFRRAGTPGTGARPAADSGGPVQSAGAVTRPQLAEVAEVEVAVKYSETVCPTTDKVA